MHVAQARAHPLVSKKKYYSITDRCCDESLKKKENDHAETELAELKQHDPANHLRVIHQPVALNELVDMLEGFKVEAVSSMPSQ